MAQTEQKEKPAPVEVKKKYRLEKSALKRNGKLYRQGSVIELTETEYKELKHILAPVSPDK